MVGCMDTWACTYIAPWVNQCDPGSLSVVDATGTVHRSPLRWPLATVWTGPSSNSKHWFTTSFLHFFGGRCRKAMLGAWGHLWGDRFMATVWTGPSYYSAPWARLEFQPGAAGLGFECSLLTPSLPWCHLKPTNTIAKFETLTHFCLLFRTGMWKNFQQNS